MNIPQPHIICFADSKFLPILLNWLVFIRRNTPYSPTIISLDKELHQFLSSRNFQTIFRPNAGTRDDLLFLRTQIFHEFNAAGQDFLHSDADALWFRDPFPIIGSINADIIVSEGTVWPLDTVRRRGFVACCGFFYAKSNNRTRDFFQQLPTHPAAKKCDQLAFNYLLEQFEVQWDNLPEQAEVLSLNGERFNCYRETVIGESRKSGLTVALLPHNKFQRLPSPSSTLYMKHPLKTDPATSTQRHLQNAGCWRLRDDWAQVSFDATTLQELAVKEPPFPSPNNPDHSLTGTAGGPWTPETHKTLYPNVFNHGLARYLSDHLSPKTTLEFGSGLGELAHFIAENSECDPVDCIEPLIQTPLTPGCSRIRQYAIDIFSEQIPGSLLDTYDLVVTIEVAEHIPREHHPALFDFLATRCGKWLVFSGARIGQGGHGHISERPEHEWREELTGRGLIFRDDLTRTARESCDPKNINHRRNVMVFQSPQSASRG